MNLTQNRRGFVRVISFSAALVIVLSLLAFSNWKRAETAERQLEYQYLKSVDDLGNYLENIQNALTKTMYAGTAPTMNQLTSKIWREAGFAKECLSTLPMGTLNLENTYKYLSQLGDYAVSLSKKMENGESLTDEERQNLSKMKEYADQFLQQVLVTQDSIRTGSISFQEAKADTRGAVQTSTAAGGFSDGFSEFEEGFTSYPTLIYDGPFSDHILEKAPDMTQSLIEISRAEARSIAAKATGLDGAQLKDDDDEEGNMPSYCFKTEDINIAVTKKGGLLSYYLKNRTVEEEAKTAEECIAAANEYLKQLGISQFKETYYEISNHIITINYANVQQDVVCYTDLVKISVAMDTGEVLRYDGRGYITNHKERTELTPAITAEQAQQSLSPLLTVKGVQTAVIPSQGMNEVLCYEFSCSSNEDENILVYVNAMTGAEQEILILYVNENGTLTM